MNRDQTELYEAAKKAGDASFGKPTSEQTYYKPYHKAKHCNVPLMEYRSEECSYLRSGLEMLWPEGDACRGCTKIILAAYVRSKMAGNAAAAPELDLFNYMM